MAPDNTKLHRKSELTISRPIAYNKMSQSLDLSLLYRPHDHVVNDLTMRPLLGKGATRQQGIGSADVYCLDVKS